MKLANGRLMAHGALFLRAIGRFTVDLGPGLVLCINGVGTVKESDGRSLMDGNCLCTIERICMIQMN